MGPGGKGPVFSQPLSLTAEGAALTRQQFPDTAEYALPRCPSQADEQRLRHAVGVHLMGHGGMAQQRFQLRGEEKSAFLRQRIEEGLDAHVVPGQEQCLFLILPHGKGKDAIEPLRPGLAHSM